MFWRKMLGKSVLGLAAALPLILSQSATRGDSLSFSLTPTSSIIQQGGTTSFDILLSNSGAAVTVAGFAVELNLDTDIGVRFTSADAPASNYIFGTVQNPPLALPGNLPSTTIDVSDVSTLPDGTASGTVIGTGSSFDLGTITLAAAANAQVGEVVHITIADILGATSLSNESFNPIGIANNSGDTLATLEVTAGATATPLPASFFGGLMCLGILFLLGLCRKPQTVCGRQKDSR